MIQKICLMSFSFLELTPFEMFSVLQFGDFSTKICRQRRFQQIHGCLRIRREYMVAHYGTKPGHFETSKIHFPTSEGVSEVSKQANE